MLYPLSYGGWLASLGRPGRLRAERQCTSVRIGWPARRGKVISSSFYSRPVLGGRWSASAARAAVLIVLLVLTGCVRQATARPSRSAEHAAAMERTEGRHLLHHRRWTGAATSQQQRELPRCRSPDHRGWRASGSATQRRN